MRRTCAAAVGPGRRDRRAGVLPRPGRLRPPRHRRRAGRALRRRALPARRRSTASPGRWAAGSPTSSRTARSTTASCHDAEQAAAVVDGRGRLRPRRCRCSTLPGSALLRAAAAAGLPTVAEGFADRAYTAAGTLVPRREPGAVIHDPAAVAARAVRMATERHGRRRRRHRRRGGRRARSACTATPRARSPGAAPSATALAEAGVALQAFA